MTPYHEYFLPIFLSGCLIASIASCLAGRLSGCVWPGLLLIAGVLSFWAGLFIGSEAGYRAWQSMPDPPAEAFSDTSAMGALILGWLPGGIFCLALFALVRGIRWILNRKKPTVVPAEVVEGTSPSVETGNPFQGPGA